MINSLRSVASRGRVLGSKLNLNLMSSLPKACFSAHVKNLAQIMYTAGLEEDQRKAKYLEYTQKVYKPSKTITFDRNGEVLLFSVDNFRHSQVYLKYPYCMIDAMIPLAIYNFFCNPCKFYINFSRHVVASYALDFPHCLDCRLVTAFPLRQVPHEENPQSIPAQRRQVRPI